MYRKKLYRDIRKEGLKAGEKSSGAAAAEATAVHDFRTHIKKLRAWLRWLSRRKKLIPRGVKALYRVSGELRDVQVLLEMMDKERGDAPALPALPAFRSWLQDSVIRLRQLRADTDATTAIRHFQSGLKMRMLKKRSLKKPGARRLSAFYDKGVQRIEAIVYLPAPTDENLHEIRKILKDLLYVYEWGIKNGMADEEDERPLLLKELGQQAGEFNDRRTALTLLNAYARQEQDEARKQEAALVEQQWEAMLSGQRTELLESLRRFVTLYRKEPGSH